MSSTRGDLREVLTANVLQATREVEVGVAAVAGGGSKVVEYDTLVLAGGAQQVRVTPPTHPD